MKVYRVSVRRPDSEHAGYEYFSNKRKAKGVQAEANKGNPPYSRGEVEEMDLTLTKKGVMAFLNAYATYPDNG